MSYDSLFSESAKASFGVSLRAEAKGETYRPQLPKPINDKQYKIIRYSRSVEEIKTLTEYFYGDRDEDVQASVIGEKCFETVLKSIKGDEV